MRVAKSVIQTLSIVAILSSFGLLWAQQDTTSGQQDSKNCSAVVTTTGLIRSTPDPNATSSEKSVTAAPDNTAKNQRDRSKSEPTADQQKENKSDRELAREVRRALVKDKSLSTYAHNIKVIGRNGVVTLKGPVNTQEEKQAVEAKAAEVAGGPDKIKSEIEVGSKQASKTPHPAIPNIQ